MWLHLNRVSTLRLPVHFLMLSVQNSLEKVYYYIENSLEKVYYYIENSLEKVY